MRFFFMKTVRNAKAVSEPNVVSIERPYSMFEFVDQHYASLNSLRRIMSQVRTLKGMTMVEEELECSDDIVEENEDIRKRYNVDPVSTVTRLSFYKKKFSTSRGLSTAEKDRFLGYAVIKTDQVGSKKCTRIYESVLAPSPHPNNCIRKPPKWNFRIADVDFEIDGYLYAQQNDMTNVCAHVALRSVISQFHPQQDISYREINQIVGIDHVNRKAGGHDGGGLSLQEMIAVLEHYDITCVVGDYERADIMSNEVPFHKFIYGSVESGYPSLLAFKTNSGAGHVIPVFGHTFNQDTWVCNAEQTYFKVSSGLKYIPSESWLSMYLAHDDNFGSNFCIPRRYLSTAAPCCIKANEQRCVWDSGVAGVIGVLPKAVRLKPIHAEVIGADYLSVLLPHIPVSDVWEHRFKWYAENSQMVLRPILVTKGEYIRHLKEIRDWEWRKIDQRLVEALQNHLQDGYYWLVELSLPELFSANKRKVAEVLLFAEEEPSKTRDFKSFSLARLPDHFVFYKGGGVSNPSYLFVESGCRGHMELFGCEDGEENL